MPDPQHLAEYYTKLQTDSRIDEKISQHNFATEEYVNNAVAAKQDVIDSDNKLDYALLSGTPTIPQKTSDLENDSGFITDAALTDYQKKITNDAKLDYALLSGTPTIPQKVSELDNDSGYQTASDVQTAISGKADTSALTAHTSDTIIHVTAANKTTWNGKQDAITNDAKLDYALLSGTPTIPTKVSELDNDSGFITDAALTDYQKKITSTAKLDYGLLSGTPTIPTKTSDLNNDSGFITNDALSGKQDLITATNKLAYSLLSGVPEENPVNVTLETKTALSAGIFTADFTGKQIQKYVYTDVTSGTIEIAVTTFTSTATDIAPTIELHIPIDGEVSTITLPSGIGIVDVPDKLTYSGQTEDDVEYHVFVLRAEKDMNGTWQYYINWAYSYIETIAE